MKDGFNWRRYTWVLTSLTGATALAAYCSSCALDINDKLGFMWVGRSATVTFFVLRRIVWQIAMVGGGMLLVGRLWRERSDRSAWKSLVAMLKLAAAVFCAVKISTSVGMIAYERVPCMCVPVNWLGMWRPFQVVEILLLVGLIPFLLLALELFQKQLLIARSSWMRVVFGLALVLGVFLGMRISSRFLRCEVERHAPCEDEYDENPDVDKGYRLTADEPGEVRG